MRLAAHKRDTTDLIIPEAISFNRSNHEKTVESVEMVEAQAELEG
jgi:hypothetical protein